METKEKMHALSQGSRQPFHAPIASPICASISQLQPIFVSNLKRGEKHHEWRRKLEEECESFPTPLITSKRVFKHPKVFLYRAK